MKETGWDYESYLETMYYYYNNNPVAYITTSTSMFYMTGQPHSPIPGQSREEITSDWFVNVTDPTDVERQLWELDMGIPYPDMEMLEKAYPSVIRVHSEEKSKHSKL